VDQRPRRLLEGFQGACRVPIATISQAVFVLGQTKHGMRRLIFVRKPELRRVAGQAKYLSMIFA
jgi:hypothetical protein